MSAGPATAPGPRLQFRLLGPLEVLRDGVALDLGAPKQRAVLAALLLADGRVVSTERLIAAVWGDDPPPRAVPGLQAYVSKLRNVLQGNDADGVRLVRRTPGYALTANWVDTAEFRQLTGLAAECVQRRSWSEAVDAAGAAVALWRGPFIDDLADEPWVSAEATRLDEMYAQCTEAWVTGLLGQGTIGEAVTRAQTLTEAYPLREHCWWLRIIALHRAGRTAEALEVYQRFAGELNDQLGLEPGPELRNLQTAILRQDAALASWPGEHGEPTQPQFDGAPPESGPRFPLSPAQSATRTVNAPMVSAIVGRDAHLAALGDVLDDISAGGYHWVLLTGAAGIGKTRLATEAAARARQRQIRTIWTSCPDDGGIPAWWPLRALVAELGSDPEEFFTPPVGVDADTLRFTLYGRFAQLLLHRASTGGPLLMVIDDAQWLDTTSIRCLTYLVRTQRLAGVAIILTVRDEQHRPEFDEVLATIGREDSALHLPVEPLDGPSASRLLHQVGGDTVSAADAFALMRHIGGSPLLLTEYARLPADERRGGHIPLAARGLLDRRLRRLPEDVLVVLRAAAVLGDTFELDLLAALTGLDLLGVIDRLDTAVAEAIIEPATTGAGYQFRHGLLRDVVAAQLTVLRRQVLHARIAELLDNHESEPHRLIRRAQHLSAATHIVGPRLVVDACSAAARAAEQVWDWDAAAQQWLAALTAQQMIPGADPANRDTLLVARLTCIVRAGRPVDALDAVAAAFSTAAALQQADSIGRLAAVLLRSGGTWGIGADRPGLLEQLDNLLPAVAAEPAAQARVLAALAVGNSNHADPDVPDRQSRAALEIAEQLGDPEVLADALVGRVVTYSGVAAHAAESRALFDRLAELEHRMRDYDELMRHNLSTMVEFSLGDVPAATEHMQEAIRAADRFRFPVARVQMRWVEAMLAQWHGDLDRADELVTKAYELHQQTASWGAELHHQNSTLALLWERGRVGSSPLLESCPEPLVWGALAAAETGDNDRGHEFLAQRLTGREPVQWSALAYRTLMAHAAVDLGAADVAPRLVELLTPDRKAVASIGHSASIGPVSLALGRLLTLVGDADGAGAELAFAEQLAQRGRGRTALLRVRLAQLQLERPAAARAESLHDLANEAERIGMNGVAAAARQTASA